MNEIRVWLILLLTQMVYISAFHKFHNTSLIRINPKESNGSDFGRSLAYHQDAQVLVVGAPSEDLDGKVYTCDMKNVTHEIESWGCNEHIIDMGSLPTYSRSANANQHFYLGASITATSEYFITCAPLWTADIQRQSTGQLMSDVFGVCFVSYYNGTVHKYIDTLDKYLAGARLVQSAVSDLNACVGGTGWSTLVDETNDLLLVVKTSLMGDFLYTRKSNPLAESSSTFDTMKQFSENYRNIGFTVTAGKFFSNETLYAFSMTSLSMTGAIAFLRYSSEFGLSLFSNYTINNKAVGSMFGATMCSADLNQDGFEDLLVGAPAYSEDQTVECGALHIYLGGDDESIEDMNRRTHMIIGEVDGGRFGSAIAVRDLDEDGYPEIIVSAPYESEFGSVYVISGYDVYLTLIKYDTREKITMSDLKLKQQLVQTNTKRLGFSLQFVSDIDENGCNELAAGSPLTGAVLLFKCVQSVNVTMTIRQISEAKVSLNEFQVEVCANVEYPKKPKYVVGELLIMNSILGEGFLLNPQSYIKNISCESCTSHEYCDNVTVALKTNVEADYTFTTEAEMNVKEEFTGSQVMTGAHSQLKKSINIPRHYKDEDLNPQLSMKLTFSASHPYVIGSTASETVTILVRNNGSDVHDGCMYVNITGAPVSLIKCGEERSGYKCYLPKPLRRHQEYLIPIVLNMTNPTNLDKELLVEALLYESCNQINPSKTPGNITVEYLFSTELIYVQGISHDRIITDKDIQDKDHLVYGGVQEYTIINNSTITWKNIKAVIEIKKESFIKSYHESTNKCLRNETEDNVSLICTMELLRNTSQKIIVTQTINKTHIESIKQNSLLNITSDMTLFLLPTQEIRNESVRSTISLRKDTTFANNKTLITLAAAILAVPVLALITYILFKKGFFERKEKKKLNELRHSVRRRSSRRQMLSELEGEDSTIMEGLQLEIEDDCPFGSAKNINTRQ